MQDLSQLWFYRDK